MKKKFVSLKNHFLIAMPNLADASFYHSVVYVCAHNEEGAMGMMINRPILDLNVGEVMKQMNITIDSPNIIQLPVLLGGPLQPERGFILHHPKNNWESTLVLTKQLAVTSSQDILQAIATGKGPDPFLIVLGYSGWGEGELENEVANNTWLTVAASPKLIFDTPFNERWEKAATLIGVDIHQLSSDIGHA